MPHYRVPFFERLRQDLIASEIELRVIVGEPTSEELQKDDRGYLPWVETVPTRYIGISDRTLVWHSCLRSLRSADLVVVEQASKLMINYALFLWRPLGGPKVAFWGHGANLDIEHSSRLGEYVKRKLARRADWWFCYTEGTARLVDALGVPADRRTVVQNAVDTTALLEYRRSIESSELDRLRGHLGIGHGPVGISLGSIYPRKRPAFLIAAADAIRMSSPDFELIVIGDGPDRRLIDDAAATRQWLHPVGALTGRDMVLHAMLGSIVLNPGVIGLAVLDGFTLGLPMIGCDLNDHGPEFEYLADGNNGLVLPAGSTAADFGKSVSSLLGDPAALRKLTDGAASTVRSHTIEEMSSRFASGIRSALSLHFR
jgi:L-malate glycosyltransferase